MVTILIITASVLQFLNLPKTPKCYLNYLTCIQKCFSAIACLIHYKVPSHDHYFINFNEIYIISWGYQKICTFMV